MNYIKLTSNDEQLVNAVYCILKESGQFMLEKYDLHHWEYPYTLENIRRDVETKNVYLLEKDGRYIATFMYTSNISFFFTEMADAKAIYISKFAVAPNCNHSGIGTQCLKFIENTIIKSGMNKIRLDVYDKSEHAINFYHKNGFVDLFKKHTKRFEVICMEKTL